ncbi:MAG: PDZ domain-containing protein [Archangium sp.]|nr:PDZ domain-containing protein [Archangium sp.]
MSTHELEQRRAALGAELRQVRRAVEKNLRAAGGRLAHSLQAELDDLQKQVAALAKKADALSVQVVRCTDELSALRLQIAAAQLLPSAPHVVDFPERFAGVGAELESRDSWPVVARVFGGGPCARAGVKPGDRLVGIDGQSVRGRSLGSVVESLRGEVDSEVSIELDRRGEVQTTVIQRQQLAKVPDGYVPG